MDTYCMALDDPDWRMTVPHTEPELWCSLSNSPPVDEPIICKQCGGKGLWWDSSKRSLRGNLTNKKHLCECCQGNGYHFLRSK